MPLKSKLILLFFAFTLVPLVLFGSIVFSQARNILKTVPRFEVAAPGLT